MSYAIGSSPPMGVGSDPTSPNTSITNYSSATAHAGPAHGNTQQANVNANFVNQGSPNSASYVSRYLRVMKFPTSNAPVDNLKNVEEAMKSYRAFEYSVPLVSPSLEHGEIRIRFDSLMDACEAKQILDTLHFNSRHISLQEYANAKFQDLAAIDIYEGQVKIVFQAQGVTNMGGVDMLKDVSEKIGQQFGDVRNAAFASVDDSGFFVFRVEFQSIDAANRAVQSIRANGFHGNLEGAIQWSTKSAEPWVNPALHASPTQAPLVDGYGRLMGFRHQPLYDGSDNRRHPNDIHNRVRQEGIVDGSDVRTTVMLRNIPNKMDHLSLKSLLDKHCFGTYDFMYLRIDFRTACNVGYAFINFSDVAGMLSMIRHIEKRTWHGFRSNKAAEISYATIQGKEALIQKFRNSSVMHESSHCKPRLFRTSTDAMAVGNSRAIGTEMDFPKPDNVAKLQRSIDSARSVGLFPPNGLGGQFFDHRNRDSPYDHGNPRGFVAMLPPDQVHPQLRRMIELWCSCSFENIPAPLINTFLDQNPLLAQYFNYWQPGVIGQPGVAGPYAPAMHGAANHGPYGQPMHTQATNGHFGQAYSRRGANHQRSSNRY